MSSVRNGGRGLFWAEGSITCVEALAETPLPISCVWILMNLEPCFFPSTAEWHKYLPIDNRRLPQGCGFWWWGGVGREFHIPLGEQISSVEGRSGRTYRVRQKLCDWEGMWTCHTRWTAIWTFHLKCPMVCLSVILLCYRITCLWFCNKRFLCNKKALFVPEPVYWVKSLPCDSNITPSWELEYWHWEFKSK